MSRPRRKLLAIVKVEKLPKRRAGDRVKTTASTIGHVWCRENCFKPWIYRGVAKRMMAHRWYQGFDVTATPPAKWKGRESL